MSETDPRRRVHEAAANARAISICLSVWQKLPEGADVTITYGPK